MNIPLQVFVQPIYLIAKELMFIIEGTIGAGKSTFLSLLSQRFPSISIAHEPLSCWSHENIEQSLLAKFYESQKRWAYTIETTTMMTRVKQHKQASNHSSPFHVIERSIYSGHYVFATNGYLQGTLSEIEWQIYLEWFDFLITNHCKAPQGFIYLRVDPEVAFTRIKKRSRSSEDIIPFEYLENIHRQHDEFLLEKKNIIDELKQVPVLTLDCNKEFELDENHQENLIQKTVEFMKSVNNQTTL